MNNIKSRGAGWTVAVVLGAIGIVAACSSSPVVTPGSDAAAPDATVW